LRSLLNAHDNFFTDSFLLPQVVRELPVIKYAKRLGNQVLASLPCLEAGCHWFGKDIRLVSPPEDAGTEEETRPYIKMVSLEQICLA
jgi:hypothetical protein